MILDGRSPSHGASPSRRLLLSTGVVALMLGALAAHAQTPPTTVRRPPAAPTRATAAAQLPLPNIVVLMVNDLGWQDLSVPLFRDTTAANRRYLTPAIQRLADSGVVFTDAYASAPTGTPTRVALLTGRSPALTRVTSSFEARDRDTLAGGSQGIGDPAWNDRGISANANTPSAFNSAFLPALLKRAGYRTAHVGVAEWSAPGVSSSDAKAIGFDESFSDARGAEALTIDALRAMNNARAARRPFFVYLAYDVLHGNSAGDARFLDDSRERALNEADAVYGSLIRGVDQSVADIQQYLDSTKLSDRTIVVLLSDNGGRADRNRSGMRFMQNAPLSGGMWSAHEGGLRIPMVVRWPGTARAGFRSTTPVVADDLFPTLLRAARVSATAPEIRNASGRDLASTLTNVSPIARDRPLLWHSPHRVSHEGPGIEPFSAIRVGSWKLIYYYSGSRYVLYDLTSDIGESRDRSLSQPKIAAALSEQLRAALKAANAQMPIDGAYGRPLPLPGRLLVPTPP